MRTFRNADVHTRVWPFLPNDDSVTLEPGETVDLDLPDEFDDVHLVPVDAKPSKKGARTQEPSSATSEPTSEEPV